MSEKALAGLVRVVDKQGQVWWTRPENVESFVGLQLTHVGVEPLPMVNGELTDYDAMYWSREREKEQKP